MLKFVNRFFYFLMISSICLILTVYQFIILPLRVISVWENIFFFIVLLTCVWALNKIKSSPLSSLINNGDNNCNSGVLLQQYHATYNSKACNICLLKRYLRYVWLDCNSVHSHELRFINVILLVILFTYASYLMLTAVCIPKIMFHSLLTIYNCNEVHNEIRSIIGYFCGIYCLFIAMVAPFMMTYEIWSLSRMKNSPNYKILTGTQKSC